jgi:hypothetical protein
VQADWPADVRLSPEQGKPMLLLIAHPQCPCTRASLGELEQIMTGRQELVKAYVLFYKPAGVAEEWVKSDLWRSATKIPGVTVEADEEGRMTRSFGADTSGQVLLYDQQTHLVFQGGITSARGHAGDNRGRLAIETFLDTGRMTVSQTPVFGCSILGEP